MATTSVVACTYGPSGIGKTTDSGYSFPRALFVAAPGALNSVEKVCGYEPDRIYVSTIQDATALIKKAAKGGYKTIVIDDFSFMAEQTFAELDKKFKGFNLWGALRDAALGFRDESRYAGVNVIINCWEQPPKTNNQGARIRGGPKLSGNLPEAIPAMCDIVLRATHETRRKPWPAVYRCHPDPSYVMKDRFDTATLVDPCPMNLGELLRASGIEIERHPDLPDQEEKVEEIANVLSGNPSEDAEIANTIYTKLVESGVTVSVARWTLRDALDRAVIRSAKGEAQSVFINVASASLL